MIALFPVLLAPARIVMSRKFTRTGSIADLKPATSIAVNLRSVSVTLGPAIGQIMPSLHYPAMSAALNPGASGIRATCSRKTAATTRSLIKGATLQWPTSSATGWPARVFAQHDRGAHGWLNSPDLPPALWVTRNASIRIERSTALHMS